MIALQLMPRRRDNPEVFVSPYSGDGAKLRGSGSWGRPRRNATWLLVIGAGCACTPRPPMRDVGVTAGRSGIGTPNAVGDSATSSLPNARAKGPPASHWPGVLNLEQRPEVARYVSQGHEPAAEIGLEVRVSADSEATRAAYLGAESDDAYPTGAELVQQLSDASPRDWSVAFVMQRTSAGFRYFLANPQGEVSEQGAQLCAACHQRGNHSVFGRPAVDAPVSDLPQSLDVASGNQTVK